SVFRKVDHAEQHGWVVASAVFCSVFFRSETGGLGDENWSCESIKQFTGLSGAGGTWWSWCIGPLPFGPHSMMHIDWSADPLRLEGITHSWTHAHPAATRCLEDWVKPALHRGANAQTRPRKRAKAFARSGYRLRDVLTRAEMTAVMCGREGGLCPRLRLA